MLKSMGLMFCQWELSKVFQAVIEIESIVESWSAMNAKKLVWFFQPPQASDESTFISFCINVLLEISMLLMNESEICSIHILYDNDWVQN